VTAASCEGEPHDLAAFGESRATTPGKAPIVLGLLTTADGAPVAVHVDAGTPADPVTGPAQVQTLRTRLGITALVFVGERGMVKATGQAALTPAGFRYSTALPPPQVRRLLHAQVLRPEWVTPHGHAGAHGTVRLLRRRSEALRQQAARRRADQWTTLQSLLTARHAVVETAQRAQPEPGLRTLQAWGKRHPLEALVQIALPDGRLRAPRDPAAQAEATVREGGSVLETEVPQTALNAPPVPDRDCDLHAVEPDVRTLKTGRLEVRPLFGRKAPRTRAQVLVTMLALNVVRERRRALITAFGTTTDDQWAVTGDEALGALARLGLLTDHVQGAAVVRWPTPDERQAAILPALGPPLPPERSVGTM
jgi:hypothetical protein